MKSGQEKKVGFHGAIGGFINRNGCVVLISKEIWDKDAYAE